jgi:hypothetical protein
VPVVGAPATRCRSLARSLRASPSEVSSSPFRHRRCCSLRRHQQRSAGQMPEAGWLDIKNCVAGRIRIGVPGTASATTGCCQHGQRYHRPSPHQPPARCSLHSSTSRYHGRRKLDGSQARLRMRWCHRWLRRRPKRAEPERLDAVDLGSSRQCAVPVHFHRYVVFGSAFCRMRRCTPVIRYPSGVAIS